MLVGSRYHHRVPLVVFAARGHRFRSTHSVGTSRWRVKAITAALTRIAHFLRAAGLDQGRWLG